MSESGWSPPCDGDELWRVLTLLRQWRPMDVDELLDDVGDALDCPPETELEELAVRLNSHLDQLSNIALADRQSRSAPYVVDLVKTSQALRTTAVPLELGAARQHVHRLGWTTSELVDQLTAHQSMKGVA